MDFWDLADEARRKGIDCVLLTKPNCPQCIATANRLEKRGKTYAVAPITAHWVEVAQEHGITSAPVVVTAEGPFWGGFRPEKIDAM